MSIILTDSQNYENIAEAVRVKSKKSALYKSSEMAQAILDIPTGGGGSEALRDIFNHGSAVGLNPLYGQYDSSRSNYVGILNSYPSGNAQAYFSIVDNNYIKKTYYNTSRLQYYQGYSVFCCPFTSAHYRKIKADCEVINGYENNYNSSAIGAVDVRRLYADYQNPSAYQSWMQSLSANTVAADRFETALTAGGTGIYNKQRSIIQVDITGDDCWLCVYLRAQCCQLNVYAIWLEE